MIEEGSNKDNLEYSKDEGSLSTVDAELQEVQNELLSQFENLKEEYQNICNIINEEIEDLKKKI